MRLPNQRQMKHTPLMRFQTLAQLLALCAAALLAGCGGGGGASPEATAQAQTPPPPRYLPQIGADEDALQELARAFENSAEYMPRTSDKNGRMTQPSRQLAQINAAMAYARGATGKDEIVAVSDSGFHTDVRYKELEGKIVYLGPGPGPGASLVLQHGANVASLIAARRDGGGGIGNMHGVAFEAKLALRKTILHGFRADLRFVTEKENKDIVRDMINLDYARDHGAAIVNFSFEATSRNYIHEYPEKGVLKRLQYAVDYLAQKNTPDADKIMVVWGAGNKSQDSPNTFAGIGVHFPELREHVLVVAAVDQKGKIAEFSNRCGVAEAFCLAAPGEDMALPAFRWQGYGQTRRGTSYSAPMVSGGLALLRQYFRDPVTNERQLGNTELVERLLTTAYRGKVHEGTPDEVDYSDSEIYGRGLMDLDAATKPYCSTGSEEDCMSTSLSDDPNAQPFNPAAFSLSGNAFGGAMRDALGGVKIAAFDELDAPFFFPLADGVSHAPQISAGHSDTLHEHEVALGGAANASLALSLAAGELSAARIRRGNLWFSYGHHGGREAGLYFGDDGGISVANFGMNFSAENSAENVANAARHFRAPLAFASPYLSLVRDGPGLGWSQPLRSGARFGFSLMHGAPQFDHFANPGGARGLGALFDFRPNNTSLSLQAGAVREADGFLGARAQGNFGEISADTAFAGIGGDWAAMQNWRLLASAYLGHTKADTGDGMLRAADDIVSSAFSLGLARAGLARRGDWLGLRLSQPLRAESGAAHLRIPAGRTKYREVLHRQHKLELTPSGRNLQVEAEYRVPFAGGNLRAGLGFDRHANHDSARDLEGFLRLGFERRF